jgi:ABC-type Fe3+ transport system permease subunit
LNISTSAAALNSFRNAGLATVISLIMAMILLITNLKSAGIKRIIFSSIGFSPTILALAAIITFGDGIFPLRSSWLITPIYEALIFFPILYFLILPIWNSISPNYLEECELAGGDELDKFFYIFWPLLKDSILILVHFIFFLVFTDFVVPNFLAIGDQETLTTQLYQLFLHPNPANQYLEARIFLIYLVVGMSLMGSAKIRIYRRTHKW